MATPPPGSGNPSGIDPSQQLDITQKLLAALTQITGELNQQATQQQNIVNSQRQQLQILNSQQTPGAAIANQSQNVASSVNNATNAMQGQVKVSNQLTGQMDKIASQFGVVDKKLDDVSKSSNKAAEGMGAFSKLSIGAKAVGGGLLGLLTSLGGAFFDIGKTILMMPFSIFDSLMEKAISNIDTNYMQALENVREKFGDLSKGSAKATIDISKNLSAAANTAGLSFYKIFQDRAQALEEILGMMDEMGAVGKLAFDKFGAGAMANLNIFAKGLGLGNEELKFLAQEAISTGQNIDSIMTDITKTTYAMGDAIGENGKVIARAVVGAMKNLTSFGGASVKQLTRSEAYLRKLGTTLQDVETLMGKFETIDQASQSAAELAQSFGVTVDAMKLVSAQSPDEMIEELRKSFNKAGVDVTKFSRQQYALLADTTGLSAEQAKLILSNKNQGASLDKLGKSANDAAKKQMTTEEAMMSLEKSIKRIVHEVGDLSTSFTQTFFIGFQTGIERTGTMRNLLRTLAGAMIQVKQAGIQVGKAFVQYFPGIKDMLEGLTGVFSGGKFRTFIKGFTQDFIKFFKMFSSGKMSFGDFMENIKKKFFNFFNTASPQGKKFFQGLKTSVLAFSKLIGQGIAYMGKLLADGIKYMFNKDTMKKTAAGAGDVGSVIGEVFSNIFGGIGEALSTVWAELKPPLMEKLGEFFVWLGSGIKDFATNTLWPAIQNLWSSGDVGKYILGGLAVLFSGPLISSVLMVLGGFIGKIMSGLGSLAGGLFGALSGGGAAASKGLGAMLKQGVAGAANLLLGFGVLAAVVYGLEKLGIFKMIASLMTQLKAFTMEDLTKMGSFMLGLIGLMAAMAALAVGIGAIAGTGVGGLAILGGLAAVAAIGAAIGYFIKEIFPVITDGISKILNQKNGDAASISAALSVMENFPTFILSFSASMSTLAVGGAPLLIFGGTATKIIQKSAGLLTLVSKTFSEFLTEIGKIDLKPSDVKEISIIIKTLTDSLLAVSKVSMIQASFGVFGAVKDTLSSVGQILFGKKGGDTKPQADPNSPMGLLKTILKLTVGVMKDIGKLEVTGDLNIKIDAFLKIFNAIQNILLSTSSFISNAKPSSEEIKSGGASFGQNLVQVNSITQNIFGGVKAIMETIKTLLDNFKDPGFIEKANVIAQIFSNVTSLMQALVPPKEFYEVEKENSIERQKLLAEGIDRLIHNPALEYLTSNQQAFTTVFNQVKGILKGTDISISADQLSVFSSVIDSVVNLIKGITPSKETIEAMKKVQKGVGSETGMWFKDVNITIDNAELQAGQMEEFLKGMSAAVEPILKGIVQSGIIDTLQKSVLAIPKDKIEALSSIGTIISSFTSLISALQPDPKVIEAMRETFSDQSQRSFNAITGAENNLNVQQSVVNVHGLQEYFKSLKEIGPNFKALIEAIMDGGVRKIIDMAASFDPKNLKNIESVSGVLAAVTTILTSILNISGPTTKKAAVGLENGKAVIEETTSTAQNIKDNMSVITEQFIPLMKTIILSVMSSDMPAATDESIKKANNLAKIFSSIGEITNTITDIIKSMKGLSGEQPDKATVSEGIKKFKEGLINSADLITNLFSPEGKETKDAITNLVKSLTDNTKGSAAQSFFSQSYTMIARLGILTKFLGNIKTIFDDITAISSSLGTLSADNISFTGTTLSGPISKVISSVNGLVQKDLKDENGNSITPINDAIFLANVSKISAVLGIFKTVKNVIDSLTTNLSSINESITNVPETGGFVTGFKNFTDGINVIPENILKIKTSLESLSGTKVDATLLDATTKTLNTISDISVQANTNLANSTTALKERLANVMQQFREITNLKAKLETVAIKESEIGGKIKYQITGPNLTVNLGVEVNMKVDEVEKVMVFRKNSILRNGINYAYDQATAWNNWSNDIDTLIPFSGDRSKGRLMKAITLKNGK